MANLSQELTIGRGAMFPINLTIQNPVDGVMLIFILDYAEPFEISMKIAKGSLVTFPSPEALGFTLPNTHNFVSWTYLGEDIEAMQINNDTVIEGRIERAPGVNLIPGTRDLVGWNVANSNLRFQRFTGSTPQGDARGTRDGYAFILGGGSTNYGNTQRVLATFAPKSSEVIPVGSVLAGSLFIKLGKGSSPGNNDPMKIDFTDISTVIFTQESRKLYIDGVHIIENSSILLDEQIHLIEFIGEINNDIPVGSTSNPLGPLFVNLGIELYTTNTSFGYEAWLPKLENVTGFPESEQRATAWTPHPDDPEQPPIDPGIPPGEEPPLPDILIDNYGWFPVVGDINLIKQNLTAIIIFQIGQRFRQEYFGTRVYESLEEPNTIAQAHLIKSFLQEGILNWEPRITKLRVETQQYQDIVKVIIRFQVNHNQSVEEMEFDFNPNTSEVYAY